MSQNLSPIDTAKFVAARRACDYVDSGMRVGLGTGSTAGWMVRCLGEMVRQDGLDIVGVPTSTRTAELAREVGIRVTTLDEAKWLDVTIDGADEFDGELNLIKGGGGALLQEKIVATASDQMIVIADKTKQVETLGAFPLPVEVVPFGWQTTKALLEETLASLDVLGDSSTLRMNGETPFVTDEGNFILDLHLGRIGNARQFGIVINQIPGVVENGLFIDICDVVVIGHGDGRVEVKDINAGTTEQEVIDSWTPKTCSQISRSDVMEFDYDLFVIGGGSGGVRAARIASAEGGAKVAIAEESRMGGTCVIRGCVPKKFMVFASGYRREMENAALYGWDVSAGTHDWIKFRDHLHGELDRLEAAYRQNLEKADVDIFDMRATIGDPHTIKLADGRSVTAKHILVATGGHPDFPDDRAQELGISSNEVFHLDAVPKRLLVVGGGYIACEFACIFSGFGSKVTQFYRGAQVLRGFDDEARGLVAEAMRDGGIDVHLGTTIIEMERRDDWIWVKASNGHEYTFDKVLFATGRAPNTAGIGLEDAGVKLGRRGEIVVDAWSQTNVPSIYAVGDVTNRINLTPVAIREGHAFADTVFGGKKRKPDHDLVPSAIFTQPEYGSVGLTEEEARDQYRIEVYCTSFRPMQTAFIHKPDRVLFKLIVDTDSRRVLGCHIVAPNAGELIQLAGVAVKMGATKEDFDRTVAVHPTISEEIVTMRTPGKDGLKCASAHTVRTANEHLTEQGKET